MITINICPSDIPKEKIRTGSNGKQYVDLVVDEKGNTHSVSVSRTKDERAARVKATYIGRGKEYVFNKQEEAPF